MARARKKRSRGEGEEEEGCCVGTLDTCVGYQFCCPARWLTILPLLVLRPPAATAGKGADPAAPRPAGRTASALYEAVRRYRVKVSPTRPACCPYTPSCSTYAVKALHRHGALRGGRLVLGRLLRCRPGAARRRGFQDPVPG
ncbi:membrane protein insertion efficiency factor YidD [Streptomyces sp. NPDC051907]|uniref:membrane protein insertion efficiency factor YidD n=1 Tax=Streptomyces sp. NPDC051907 TaxID=3155284 RepID=UPI0034451E65